MFTFFDFLLARILDLKAKSKSSDRDASEKISPVSIWQFFPDQIMEDRSLYDAFYDAKILMMRFWAKIPSEISDFSRIFWKFLVLAHNILKVARRAGVPSGEARRVILVELTFSLILEMARRAGVPSGEARRVILVELTFWLILEIRKSVQKCHGDTNFWS